MNKHLTRLQAAYNKPATKVVIGLVAFVIGLLVIHGADVLPYLFGGLGGLLVSAVVLAPALGKLGGSGESDLPYDITATGMDQKMGLDRYTHMNDE